MRITPEEYRNQRYGTRVRYGECRVYWFERGETLEVEHVTQDEETQQWFVHLRGVPEPRPCGDHHLFAIPLNPTEIILSVLRMDEEAATYRRYLQTIANYFDDPKQVSAEDMTYRERVAAMYNQALGGLESGAAGSALLEDLHAAKDWAALWKRAAKQQKQLSECTAVENTEFRRDNAELRQNIGDLNVNIEASNTRIVSDRKRYLAVRAALQEIADDCPDTLPQLEDYADADDPEDDLLIDRVKFRLGGIARRALEKDEANEA